MILLHKGNFMMLYVSIMDGHCLTFLQSVFVVPHSLSNMPSIVLMVVFQLFTIMRYITTQLMSEVCPNVATEPTLQPVTNECFFHCSANTKRFWGLHHRVFDKIFSLHHIGPDQSTSEPIIAPHIPI